MSRRGCGEEPKPRTEGSRTAEVEGRLDVELAVHTAWAPRPVGPGTAVVASRVGTCRVAAVTLELVAADEPEVVPTLLSLTPGPTRCRREETGSLTAWCTAPPRARTGHGGSRFGGAGRPAAATASTSGRSCNGKGSKPSLIEELGQAQDRTSRGPESTETLEPQGLLVQTSTLFEPHTEQKAPFIFGFSFAVDQDSSTANEVGLVGTTQSFSCTCLARVNEKARTVLSVRHRSSVDPASTHEGPLRFHGTLGPLITSAKDKSLRRGTSTKVKEVRILLTHGRSLLNHRCLVYLCFPSAYRLRVDLNLPRATGTAEVRSLVADPPPPHVPSAELPDPRADVASSEGRGCPDSDSTLRIGPTSAFPVPFRVHLHPVSWASLFHPLPSVRLGLLSSLPPAGRLPTFRSIPFCSAPTSRYLCRGSPVSSGAV